MNPSVLIASDHGGVKLKGYLIKKLARLGIPAKDLGAFTEDSVDYPDYGLKLAGRVGRGKNLRGILICKSGIGMSVTANKVKGVRAALCLNETMARLAREHTNANVLVLGAQFVPARTAGDILQTWLTTPFAGGRHNRRLKKIHDYERENLDD